MKRIDLLKQRDTLAQEIKHLKKIHIDARSFKKSMELNKKLKMLEKRYDFINNLLKVNTK